MMPVHGAHEHSMQLCAKQCGDKSLGYVNTFDAATPDNMQCGESNLHTIFSMSLGYVTYDSITSISDVE